MPNFNEQFADRFAGFYKSDIWHLMKWRLLEYKTRLEKKALQDLRDGETDSAKGNSAMSYSIDQAINITERISGELKSGKLDADTALGVIGNKAGTKQNRRKSLWTTLRKLVSKPKSERKGSKLTMKR